MNSTERPIVSVVVPMRNAERYIGSSLQSILAEQQVPLEVIVVDDRSTDESADRVRSIGDSRVRLLDGPGKGIAACLNVGYQAATADLIMRCDADDLYPSHRIRRQVDWMQENPHYDAVCGGFATIDARGEFVSNLSTGEDFADITEELLNAKSRTTLCTFAVRLATVKKNKGFREYFETAEDLDYQFRLAEVGRIAYLPETNYLYRIHAPSITHSQSRDRRLFFEETAKQFSIQRLHDGIDGLQRGTPPTPPNNISHADSKSATDHIQGILLGRAWEEFAKGNSKKAFVTGLRAVKTSPNSLATWKSFLAMIRKIVLGP